MRRRSSYVVAAVLLALTVPAAPAPAAPAPAAPAPAAPAPAVPAPAAEPEPLATDLLSPLSQAVAEDGTIWFSQNYAGLLQRIDPDGTTSTVVTAPDGLEIAAVSESEGTLSYTVTGAAEGQGAHTLGVLHERAPDGTDTEVVDLYAHEQETNPDAVSTYGFADLPPACATQVPRDARAPYTGVEQSHPVASVRAHGAVYLADAAANAVTAVAGPDTATTVLAFPPVRTTVTPAYAEENGFPDCTVGRDYWAEAVPTDVEVGPYGSLYVTTFPGASGRVDGRPAGTLWRVLILTGQASVVADGLDTPVGIAVADDGDVYVSELQADRISRVAVGSDEAVPWAETIFPGDLEWTPDGLVAGVDVLSGTSGEPGDPPRGELVRFN